MNKMLYHKQMREMDNDNLNRFIGMSLDGPQLLSVWKFCSRGSLNDVIVKGSLTMDSFFIFCLVRDIANIYFGPPLSFYAVMTQPERRKVMYTGRRCQNFFYSFGIICAQLVTRTSPWDLDNRKEDPDEILYMVKKGGHIPMRPSLTVEAEMEISPAFLHLIRDCWTERPSERPTMEMVRTLMRSMNSNRNDNLMDHVFNMLESYASTLESEVEERTKELFEEKKKSDILLYRMLPKWVDPDQLIHFIELRGIY
ncbi:hypothetical protein OESDEN_12139 [Oesophagostomum dentatum]|uniref:Protein kinase domain-containing protein n=1 Tax=Oesophagostomum dentatum TaxID=61180 RepID=A0A0B1SY14_OESDE|nr:hypothetical protein OESDEN_12139 [Oesophagostomum dentatum]